MTNKRIAGADNFVAHPLSEKLVKISGKIINYKKSREKGVFVFTKNDKSTMEVVAVLAGLAGLGGQAIAVSANAHSMEEMADYVEFQINDKELKGWLWRSPFSDCDHVDVAAEWQGEYYELFGVCRPSDRTIALYPHCSRARAKHIKNAIKWWFLMLLTVYSFMFMIDYFDYRNFQKTVNSFRDFFRQGYGWPFAAGIFAAVTVPAISMTMQWMPFVRVAEKVFETLELPNPGNIDLVKSSRSRRTIQDAAEYGSMYFRY